MRKLILLSALLVGCGGGGQNAPDSKPSPGDSTANVAGQYNIVLTSKSGATINVYANLIQAGTTLSSDTSTLVCPGNLLLNCVGDDAPAIQFVIAGEITGSDIQMSIPYSDGLGTNDATVMGTVAGTNLSGTYVDVRGDSGNWTGTKAKPLNLNLTGTLQSNSNPVITPTIMLNMVQATQNTNLNGTAVVTNSTCFTSLSMPNGSAIGGAFVLSNTSPNILFIGLPTNSGYVFQYSVGQDGACAGDSGTGTLH